MRGMLLDGYTNWWLADSGIGTGGWYPAARCIQNGLLLNPAEFTATEQT